MGGTLQGGRAAAALGGESELGSFWRLGMTPTGGPRLSAREEGRREPGCWAGPRRPVRLGRAGGRKGRERPSWAGPRGRKRKEEKEK
jgi:hypothetical protein